MALKLTKAPKSNVEHATPSSTDDAKRGDAGDTGGEALMPTQEAEVVKVPRRGGGSGCVGGRVPPLPR